MVRLLRDVARVRLQLERHRLHVVGRVQLQDVVLHLLRVSVSSGPDLGEREREREGEREREREREGGEREPERERGGVREGEGEGWCPHCYMENHMFHPKVNLSRYPA